MTRDVVDALATALAREGPYDALVRSTETGERYVDLATDASAQPVASVWFDADKVVWGDEYQFSLPLGMDHSDVARAVLYTLRDEL